MFSMKFRYYNFQSSFKLRSCRTRNLFGSQIPVINERFELRISCIQKIVCKRFAVQTLLWSLEFVIDPNKTWARHYCSSMKSLLKPKNCFSCWVLSLGTEPCLGMGRCAVRNNITRLNPERREKIKLNFYFHTSLWCLKRFKGLHKTFWGTTKKCDNENLT